MSSSSAPNGVTALKDASVAAALAAAVVIVLLIDMTSKRPEAKQPDVKQVITTVTPPEPEPIPLRIAVTEPEFDDMGRLLNSLGSGFRYSTITVDSLIHEATLKEIDILFLTCGGVPDSWVDQVIGDAERGQKKVTVKQELYSRAIDNLRNFVRRGGQLYASDQRYLFVRNAFPDSASSSHIDSGAAQTVNADVVDTGLSGQVGERISLPFDKPGWYPAAFEEERVTVLMRGAFRGLDGGQYRAPLLVKFKEGEGFVIFTAFHNEKVNSDVAIKLLKYLVFATVLAKTEEKTAQITTSGGLVAKGKSLLSASAADPSVTQVYKCTKAGPLRFVLGFEERGARIKLTVVSPAGQKHEREGTSTFQIDVPNAEVGDWKYTITALKMPHDNFPYSLTIGGK